MLKVGLVGVGGISGSHIPNWEKMEDTELVALCDVRPERMEPYPQKRHYTSLDDMLANERLDILDICLPTYLHADVAVKALEMGINVICEKPISLKKEDVARVYGAASRNNAVFMVAQVLRFWPEYEFVKEAYESGKYGRLISGSMTRLGHIPAWSWDGWMQDESRSGLTPFDLHIHDLDFMVYAFGNPQNATSFRAKRSEQDYLNVVYEYDGFFLVTEAAWYGAQGYPFNAKFRFQFEEAMVVWEDRQLCVYPREGGKLTVGQEEGESGGLELPKTNAYGNEIRYFVDCVKQGVPAQKVKPEELETVLELIGKLRTV